MPTYDYKCQSCGHAFEELQSFSEPPLTRCPACKKKKLERLFGGGGAVIFQGAAVYETDYRRAGDGKANGDGKAADAPAGGEAKSEVKAESASAAGGDSASSGGKAAAEKPADTGKAKKAK